MNEFENGLLRYFSRQQLDVISSKKLGIAGCGGLGSNIAAAMARSGFVNFEIVDRDIIDASNLNRQNYFLDEVGSSKVVITEKRLKAINQDIQVLATQTILTYDNIREHYQNADIIFEAFDNVESKKLIIETFGNSGKLVILASGMAGFSNANEIRIKTIKDNVYMVGDRKTEVGLQNPPLAPRVIACAALMASVALERTLS